MNKLKTHIIHYKDVFASVGITPNNAHIDEYLNGGRQDIKFNSIHFQGGAKHLIANIYIWTV